jgi:hypothetical protein
MGGGLDFETLLYSGGYKIIIETYSTTELQIWAEGVKDVAVQWFHQQLRRLSAEGNPLVGASTGCLFQHTHTLMDFTPLRTTRHAIILKRPIHQTVLKLIQFVNGVLLCSTTQGNGNTRFTFSSINFTSITMNVYLQNKITLYNISTILKTCVLLAFKPNLEGCNMSYGGTRWRSWLKHCTTIRKVAGSIPDGVIGIFH